MRLKGAMGMVVVLLGLVSVGGAQELSGLPSCAVSCLANAIAASPCQPTNQTCICTDAELTQTVEECVLQSCTVRQALTTKNTTLTACNAPTRSKTQSLKLTNILLASTSTLCVLLRLLYKAFLSPTSLSTDDYLILAMLVFGLPSTIIQDRGTIAHGLGTDVWTLPFDTITAFIRWFYVMEVLYFFNVAMLKLSLLFFFLRIFPAGRVKRLLWGTIVFDVVYGVVFILVGVFQCWPVRHYWERWDGEAEPGRCVDVNALGWANAGVSIVLDVWMLGVPLWQVSRLQLAWRKKVGVGLMFFVGTFVTVISVVRLQSLITFGASLNPTWDYAAAASWSTIEINVGIMCACMPALRLILMRFFPSVFGTTHHTKYGTQRSGTLRSGSRPGNEDARAWTDVNAITYTTTFEVRHSDNDEERLVQMDELTSEGGKARSSGGSGRSVCADSAVVAAERTKSL